MAKKSYLGAIGGEEWIEWIDGEVSWRVSRGDFEARGGYRVR